MYVLCFFLSWYGSSPDCHVSILVCIGLIGLMPSFYVLMQTGSGTQQSREAEAVAAKRAEEEEADRKAQAAELAARVERMREVRMDPPPPTTIILSIK